VSLSRWIDLDWSTKSRRSGPGWLPQPPSELLASFSAIRGSTKSAPKTWCSGPSGRRWQHRPADLRATVAEIYSKAARRLVSASARLRPWRRRSIGATAKAPRAFVGMSVYDQIGRSLMSGRTFRRDCVCAGSGTAAAADAGDGEEIPATFPGLDYKWKRSVGWEQTAKLFRVTKAAKVQGEEMIASALLREMPNLWQVQALHSIRVLGLQRKLTRGCLRQ